MLIRAPIPTTDLYFLNSCGDLVGRPWRRGPVQRMGANVFRVGERYLVIRRDVEDVIKEVLSNPTAEIIYLIDDNLNAVDDDGSLPEGYRTRLRTLRDDIYRRMLDRAALVVASSAAITEGLPAGTASRLINPVWRGTPRPRTALTLKAGERLDMVHLGTGSHGAGFQFLTPALEHVLARASNLHFNYFSARPLLQGLDNHPRVHRLRPKSWRAYQRALPGFRFHLGLYPISGTPFNAARSINKILEYTLAGCPAMYNAAWAAPHGLVDGHSAFLAGSTMEAWADYVMAIVEDPSQLAAVYDGARAQYAQMNDLSGQRAFWQDIFIRTGQ
ncbi:hypothetical protein [Kordiimonas sp.]|uniref:hypothetical protein n=1 Tax=Kordiimonas sp. TaxID=1970157 RepID=UPI003A8ED830